MSVSAVSPQHDSMEHRAEIPRPAPRRRGRPRNDPTSVPCRSSLRSRKSTQQPEFVHELNDDMLAALDLKRNKIQYAKSAPNREDD